MSQICMPLPVMEAPQGLWPIATLAHINLARFRYSGCLVLYSQKNNSARQMLLRRRRACYLSRQRPQIRLSFPGRQLITAAQQLPGTPGGARWARASPVLLLQLQKADSPAHAGRQTDVPVSSSSRPDFCSRGGARRRRLRRRRRSGVRRRPLLRRLRLHHVVERYVRRL